MQISIIGDGAIGRLLSGYCIDQNLSVEFWSSKTKPEQFSFRYIDGKEHQITIPRTQRPNHAIHHSEPRLIFVTTKVFQVQHALEQWSSFIQRKDVICLLCNGMGIENFLMNTFPNPIVRGTTNRAALKYDNGDLSETGFGETHLGWLRPDTNKKPVEALISNTWDKVSWHQDIYPALWLKLAINAVINPLTAANDIRNGELSGVKYQRLISALIDELDQLFALTHIAIDKPTLNEKINQVITHTASNYSSMHQDVKNNRPTELEYITGYILSKARGIGLHMPHHEELYNALSKK